MAKWGVNELDKNDGQAKEQWEYARFLFNWKQDMMDVGNGKCLHWAETWDMFDRMGEDGWEMIAVTPLSTPVLGHGAGDTNNLLFVLKRRKVMAKTSRLLTD